jgi:hypothetical protein
MGRKGVRSAAGGFLWWPGGVGREEKEGQGVRGSVPLGGENGEERASPEPLPRDSGGRRGVSDSA